MTDRDAEIERLGKLFPIKIVKYNPDWPKYYDKESARIKKAFPDGLIVSMHHIGSTSVPGLDAKAVIDILICVKSMDKAKNMAVAPLEKMGYGLGWEDSHIVMFGGYYPEEKEIKYHLHIADIDNEEMKCLSFRNYLRVHKDAAEEYAMLKYRLAEKFKYNREAYTAAKSEFILQVTKKAVEEGC